MTLIYFIYFFTFDCFVFSERGVCLPTVSLWILFVYIEAAIRFKDLKNFHVDLCRPFAAHWWATVYFQTDEVHSCHVGHIFTEWAHPCLVPTENISMEQRNNFSEFLHYEHDTLHRLVHLHPLHKSKVPHDIVFVSNVTCVSLCFQY